MNIENINHVIYKVVNLEGIKLYQGSLNACKQFIHDQNIVIITAR